MNSKHDKKTDQTKSNLLTRGDFLARAGGAMLATAAATASCLGGQSTITMRHKWKGRKGSNVKRWDVITIGNLSRNRYWGESAARGVRAAICTCTLITGKDFRVLVDPSLTDEADMAGELDRRTGIKPRDITAVFVTHQHRDHLAGIAHFPDSKWLAAPAVAEIINKSGTLPRVVEGAADRLFGSIDMIP